MRNNPQGFTIYWVLKFNEESFVLKDQINNIKKALDANWKGYEQIHRDCLGVPKYGNDDDYADLIATDIIC
ncbi:pyruvate formate lyase family protein [Neobacillus niacini]|uniref:pyruvate formate lyase family protein n=1 Tax=Neobacillus niacini TaxID=86668 RepID=UPI003B58673A